MPSPDRIRCGSGVTSGDMPEVVLENHRGLKFDEYTLRELLE